MSFNIDDTPGLDFMVYSPTEEAQKMLSAYEVTELCRSNRTQVEIQVDDKIWTCSMVMSVCVAVCDEEAVSVKKLLDGGFGRLVEDVKPRYDRAYYESLIGQPVLLFDNEERDSMPKLGVLASLGEPEASYAFYDDDGTPWNYCMKTDKVAILAYLKENEDEELPAKFVLSALRLFGVTED